MTGSLYENVNAELINRSDPFKNDNLVIGGAWLDWSATPDIPINLG